MTDNATPMPGTADIRNHIPMDYLERHPGDLGAAMRDYAEDRWKLIDRLKKAQDERAALLSALEKALNAAEVFVDGGDLAALPAFEEWLPEARAAIASARP